MKQFCTNTNMHKKGTPEICVRSSFFKMVIKMICYVKTMHLAGSYKFQI